MMNNVSVRTRLLLMLIVPLFLYAGTSTFLLSHAKSALEQANVHLHEVSYQATSHVLNADRDMYQALAAYQQLQAAGLSPEGKEEAFIDYQANVEQVKERTHAAYSLLESQQATDTSHLTHGITVEQAMRDIESTFDQWVSAVESNFQSGRYADEDQVLFDQARNHISVFSEIMDQYADERMDALEADNARISWIIFALVIGSTLAVLAVGIVLIRHMNRTVKAVLHKTQEVSEGRLNVAADAHYAQDELGRISASVDQMIASMRSLIGEISSMSKFVHQTSEELTVSIQESATASTHVAENIQEVTVRVEQQSDIANETSRAMEEMASGVQKIAESTVTIADHFTSTTEQVEDGSRRLHQLNGQLNQMNDAISQMSQAVHSLTERSDRIGSIAESMTRIAQQTGILSLNASIEAARAGEQGKGFAVVAQEIRKLAASSLQSAEDIASLIDGTRSDIELTSRHMEATSKQAVSGNRIAEEVTLVFEDMLHSIRHVAEQIHEASAVTEQMSASSEEVSASMEQSASSSKEIAGRAHNVAAATEEQLALVENITVAAERLGETVRRLNESLSRFEV